MKRSRLLANGLFVLVAPVLQLLFFRLFLHEVLHLRIGFRFTTDFDYIIPGPVAFLLLFAVLARDGIPRLSLQRRALLVNVSFCAFFLLANLMLAKLPAISGIVFWSCWSALLSGMVLSSFCLFVPGRFYVLNPRRWAVIPSLFIAFSFPLYMNSYSLLWTALGRATSRSVAFVFDLVWPGYTNLLFGSDGLLLIQHPTLSLTIGRGCIGLDALFLFFSVFAAFFMLHRRRWSLSQWFAFGGIGLCVMYLANIFRIILLFWSGVMLRNVVGFRQGTILFKTIAHTHLGWVLYLVVLTAFFALLERWAGAETQGQRNITAFGAGRHEGV